MAAKFGATLAEQGLKRWSRGFPDRFTGRERLRLALFVPAHKLNLPGARNKALARLRDTFGPSFGPAVFDASKQVLFALQNRVIVGFGRGVEANTAEAILRKSGAVTHTSISLGNNMRGYLVIYPSSWGLAILATGRRLAAQKSVEYVEHQMFVLESSDTRGPSVTKRP